MDRLRGYFYCGFATTWNILVNMLTGGRRLWLEGQVRRGVFRNWLREFTYRPAHFAQPASEQELIDLIRNSSHLRVCGAGHSFNDGVVSDHTLISLDRYRGLVWKDLSRKQICVRGGTRVRELVALLLVDGLALAGLPSHDAQSIAGVLATDVHGTGRSWGWLSELVIGLRLIDGTGTIHDLVPTDDLFRAVVGGAGAFGIVTEVTLQAVDRFNVEQRVQMVDLTYAREHLDQLLDQNEHLSLYVFPFARKCQINTWNSTGSARSRLGPLREFVAISADALLSAWFGGLMSYAGWLPRLSNFAYGFKRGTDLVMESNQAFNRTIYHLHQELEFTVPYADTWTECDRFLQVYQSLYSSQIPYGFLEVRFTPAGHTRTLLGAGFDRRSTWIDLICNDSPGFRAFYAEAEKAVRAVGARPHLGKFCETITPAYLAQIHGTNFDRFHELRKIHDPDRKFANTFTRRIFGD